MTLLTVLLASGTYMAFKQVTRPGDLPPPTTRLAPSPENLGAVMAVGQSGRTALIQMVITIPNQDADHFREHLDNAAVQRGWFVYHHSPRASGIIMPAEELPALNDLEANPIGWVTRETARPRTAKGPSTLNLVQVRLIIDSTESIQHALWLILTVLGVCATIMMAIFTPMGYSEAWSERHKAVPGRT